MDSKQRKKISNDPLFKKVKKILLDNGIDLKFCGSIQAGIGSFQYPNKIVVGTNRFRNYESVGKIPISYENQIREVLSACMHELAHFFQYKNGLWKSYLTYSPSESSHSNSLRKYLRTALRCERDADRKGKKMMSEYFKGIKYIPSYFDPDVVKKWKLSEKMNNYQQILKMRYVKKRK